MANTLLVSVGSDATSPAKFYWNINNASTRKVILERQGFDSQEEARSNLEEFKDDLARAEVLLNIAAKT